MKKHLLIICLFISAAVHTARADGNIMFEQANALYHIKNYDSAAKLYTRLVENGFCSDDLYYNMGNAFYRARKVGWAIWSYRKSMAIDCDKYTLDNYRLAKKLIKNPLLEQKEIFFLRWWRSLYSLCTVNVWSIWALLSFVVFLLLTFFKVVKKMRIASFLRYSFLALFLSSFLLMFVRYYNGIHHYEAVMIDAAYFTQEGSTEAEKIPEGSEIRILDKKPHAKDDLMKVKLSDLREGYIDKVAMKPL